MVLEFTMGTACWQRKCELGGALTDLSVSSVGGAPSKSFGGDKGETNWAI